MPACPDGNQRQVHARRCGKLSAAGDPIQIPDYAPEADKMGEYFNRSLKYEHLCQREIEQAAELAEEVAAYLELYNEVRPHEALGQRIPLAAQRGDQRLFWAPSVQASRHGTREPLTR